MALVAIGAVVHVPAYALVPGIGLGLGVAIGAGEYRVVRRVGVARGANAIRTAMVEREVGVVKRGSQPGGCAVARRARGGEVGRGVVRVRGG